jgi:hypothetical protein
MFVLENILIYFFLVLQVFASNKLINISYTFEINDGKLWLCGETYGIITQFVINDKKAIRCNEKHLLIFWWKVLAEDKYTREYFPLYLGEQRDCSFKEQVVTDNCPLIKRFDSWLFYSQN